MTKPFLRRGAVLSGMGLRGGVGDKLRLVGEQLTKALGVRGFQPLSAAWAVAKIIFQG
jgi:hypothetical protein